MDDDLDDRLWEKIENMESVEDFVAFLALLRMDCWFNGKEWNSWTLPDYLETLSAHARFILDDFYPDLKSEEFHRGLSAAAHVLYSARKLE